ncbi:peroxisomal trans-2-enoyl-CoA reductase-like [Ostrea edulis]|uniref:peroxisomal trans-2-enoyl-CoA reductase-like n=1 Tax=Ostrea edulis TaxID=37623 RepID=UPI0024AED572|nr:peroxisomal trans-2-enoyl-CoA reductase-like [Ostrea edulis]
MSGGDGDQNIGVPECRSHDTKMASSSGKVSSVFRSGLFNGKVAIVTGGSTGIGRAITQELLYLGCKVIIASRNAERLSSATAIIQKQIPNDSAAEIANIQCNIRKEDQVKKMISETLSKFGKIDFLVNNGGGQFPGPASSFSLKGWNAVIETNLTGTYLCCREVYNQWMSEHGGVIINIIADMWKGFPGMSHTGAARSAVDNLTKSLSLEWASSGVRINAVAPGSSIFSETAAANYNDKDIFKRTLPYIPARRLGTPAEISAAVCFLLSPAAAFISGESLKVDGAASLHGGTWDIPEHNNLPAYDWETDDAENPQSKSKL